ncbi:MULTISPECIES: hypothetical protein [unclassified Sphingobium]|uniref:hypothetical protein n=1 Tax=unclassified Sphingobium TaxID=2611147 RepID=UPI00222569A3|nr:MULTISPECIES: hypothetical protein [unclassified Sphingobium]MCW2349668.1 hypothetical protein [Sphingobium sp. B12D2B]MCW2368772.1 hypothetical protein [Sphingobium sp. B11D3D]
MVRPALLIAASVLGPLALQGCVARTAYKVAKAPVDAGAKMADWATVSGDEADRERGRELRRKCKARYDPYYCK